MSAPLFFSLCGLSGRMSILLSRSEQQSRVFTADSIQPLTHAMPIHICGALPNIMASRPREIARSATKRKSPNCSTPLVINSANTQDELRPMKNWMRCNRNMVNFESMLLKFVWVAAGITSAPRIFLVMASSGNHLGK